MKVSIMAVVLAASMLFCNEGLAEHKTCWCVDSGCVYEFEANGSHMSVTSKSESGDGLPQIKMATFGDMIYVAGRLQPLIMSEILMRQSVL